MTEIKSVHQTLKAALDSFILNLPTFLQNDDPLQNQIQKIKFTISGILNGQGDELWNSYNKELDKRLEEAKLINIRLKQNQANSSAAFLKNEKKTKSNQSILKTEISDSKNPKYDELKHQNEEEEEAIQKNPISKHDIHELIEMRQQEIAYFNQNLEKNQYNYSVRIQQASQEVDKYKREIEIIEMQLNSMISRILMTKRTGNFQKREVENLNTHWGISRTNDSTLPQLNLKKQSRLNSSNVSFKPSSPLSKKEINEMRYPVSEPQIGNSLEAYNRRNRAYFSNSNHLNNKDDQCNYSNFHCNDLHDDVYYYDDKLHDNDIHENKKNYQSDVISKNDGINTDTKLNTSENIKVDKIEIQTSRKCINIKQTDEMTKTDKKISEMQAALDEAEDYLNEIDEIISDNFEDKNYSDDETP